MPNTESLNSTVRVATLGLILLGALGAAANDDQRVQVSSLEVKSRIASIEQVNVTAEKPIDENAAAPSDQVSDLLAELESLDAPTPVSED